MEKESELKRSKTRSEIREAEIEDLFQEIRWEKDELKERENELDEKEKELRMKEQEIDIWEKGVKEREMKVKKEEERLQEDKRQVQEDKKQMQEEKDEVDKEKRTEKKEKEDKIDKPLGRTKEITEVKRDLIEDLIELEISPDLKDLIEKEVNEDSANIRLEINLGKDLGEIPPFEREPGDSWTDYYLIIDPLDTNIKIIEKKLRKFEENYKKKLDIDRGKKVWGR